MIFIAIPVFNRIEFTCECLESIRSQIYKEWTVVVCDDGSKDNTTEIIASSFPEVIILKGNGNLWWTGGTNECVKFILERATVNDYIFTLNNDTVLLPETLNTLIKFGSLHPNSIVACGNYFINDRSRLESTAFIKRFKSPFSEYHLPLYQWGEDVSNLKTNVYEVNSVSGKGVLIPVPVFHKVGIYNFEKLPHYHADTEFTRRANKTGYQIFLLLDAIILTHQDASGIGQVNSKLNIAEFFKSFFSLRSENYLPSLYNRSRVIYGRKWLLYLVANVISTGTKFLRRYLRSIKMV